jgi:hypothetical protein
MQQRNHIIRLFLLVPFLSLLQSTSAADLPSVTHYRLDVQFQLKDQRVAVVAALSVTNATDKPCTKLPFILYRLLSVDRVSDNAGAPLSFNQDVVQLRDEPSLQAREVVVDLRSPLKPNDSVTVVLTYSGFIFGYPEVMAYVKDRIDEDYSLLRPDAFAYPVLAEPTFASALAANDTKFTYAIAATVPKGYHVACGGEAVGSRTNSDSSTFLFRSKIPTWRMDIAVAKFAVISNPNDQLVVYYLPEDSVGARRVLDASIDVIKFYSEKFGRPQSYRGYTVIEIPDGWGSQASDYYFLQTAAAFKDSSRIPEVYHEIGHTWNANASGEVQRCRYFDEAFASFFAAIAVRAFSGEKAFEEDMEKSRDVFVRWAQHDREVFDTPIAGYGAKELGRHSYTKGAWSLYVLYRVVGEETFDSIIRKMVTQFAERPINFEEFETLCERTAGRDLRKFFQEWIYGTESSRLLVDKVPIGEIVKRY